MQFTKATNADKDEVFAMVQKVVANMISNGLNQWDEVYPSYKDIINDIDNEELYLLRDEEQIASMVVLNEKADPAYEHGNWTFNNPKIAILHRLCVNPDFQNKGLGAQIVLSAEEELRKSGYKVIRLDAFSENSTALHLYQKLGYSPAGEIELSKGKFFLFEKSLSGKLS